MRPSPYTLTYALMFGMTTLTFVACAKTATLTNAATSNAAPRSPMSSRPTPTETLPTNWLVRDIGKPGVPVPSPSGLSKIRDIEKAIGSKRSYVLRFAYPPHYGLVVYDGDFYDADGHAPNLSLFSIDLINCENGIMYRPSENDTMTIPHEDQTDKQFLHSWRCPGY